MGCPKAAYVLHLCPLFSESVRPMPSQNMTGQTQRGRKQITAYTEQPGASGFASPYRQISRPEIELYQSSSMQLRRQGRNRTATTGENTHTHTCTHTQSEKLLGSSYNRKTLKGMVLKQQDQVLQETWKGTELLSHNACQSSLPDIYVPSLGRHFPSVGSERVNNRSRSEGVYGRVDREKHRKFSINWEANKVLLKQNKWATTVLFGS